jgi:ribulose-phosphate 3-epimerase
MIENPELWIDRCAKAGASSITFHLEGTTDAVALTERIQSLNCRAAVAIKPATPVNQLSDDLLARIDMLLVMTVEPGFGGQVLVESCLEKVKELRTARQFSKNIQVDGGIGPDNVKLVHEAGANVIVAGNSIFASCSPGQVIQDLRQ